MLTHGRIWNLDEIWKTIFSPDKVPLAPGAKHNTLFSQSWQLLEQLAGVSAMGRDLKVSLLKNDF